MNGKKIAGEAEVTDPETNMMASKKLKRNES